jgi:hypothetical protein
MFRQLTVPHNADRILTTHVGSLIRPPKLIEFLAIHRRRQAL